MDAGLLRSFLQIAKLGSISRAAQILNLSQPTLSRRIALLEGELGASLFQRHQRGVSLSPAGEFLVGRAVGILRQLDEVSQEIAQHNAQPSGRVAIGLPPSLVPLLGAQLLEEYAKSFPKVKLFVFEGINNELEEKLLEGELDLAMMPSTRARLRGIVSKPLAVEDMVLATVSDISTKPCLSIPDIVDLPLVLARLPNYMRWRVEVAFQRYELSPQIVAETNSLTTLLELTRRGIGSAIIPRSAVTHDVGLGRMRAIPLQGMSVTWMIAMSRPGERSLALETLYGRACALVDTLIDNGVWQARHA